MFPHNILFLKANPHSFFGIILKKTKTVYQNIQWFCLPAHQTIIYDVKVMDFVDASI